MENFKLDEYVKRGEALLKQTQWSYVKISDKLN